jgi:hypothetical protein
MRKKAIVRCAVCVTIDGWVFGANSDFNKSINGENSLSAVDDQRV